MNIHSVQEFKLKLQEKQVISDMFCHFVGVSMTSI